MTRRAAWGPSCIALACIVLFLRGTLVRAASFQMLDFIPVDMSDDGSVVVGHDDIIGFPADAFRWEDGVTTHLGPWMPQAISGDGQTILISDARLWRDGTLTDLPPADGYTGSGGGDLSYDGSVVVGSSHDDASGTASDSVLWTNGVPSALGLPDFLSSATVVSRDGRTVAGFTFDMSGEGMVYRWRDGAVTHTDLALMPSAVSDDGSVIVSGLDLAFGKSEACRWEDGELVELPHLPGADLTSALDVSANGSVTVGHSGTEVATEAVMWTDEGIQRLADVFEDDYGLDLGGWTLTSARGISADGQTLIGVAEMENPYKLGLPIRQGWIAHIPEPTTGGLVLAGLAGVAFGRRRRGSRGSAGSVASGLMLLVTVLGFAQSAPAAGPRLEALEFLPSDVSGDGSVIVGYEPGETGLPDVVCRWEDGATTALGEGVPAAVSSDGQAIVTRDGKLWRDGVWSDLPPLPDYTASTTWGLSEDGSKVVGSCSYGGSGFGFESVVWVDGVASTLGMPGFPSGATAISPDGRIVAGFCSTLPYRWEDGAATHTNLLGVPWAMSDDGSVIVGGTGGEGLLWGEACRWDDGEATYLASLPGALKTCALDLTADGSVAVGFSGIVGATEAVLWNGTELFRLSDVLEDERGLDLTGWALTEAVAMSDDGQTLVGVGVFDDGEEGPMARGWVVHLPEPTTGLVLMVGLGGVVLRRRRRWDLGARASRLGMLVLAVLLSGSSSETLAAGPSFHGLGAETTVADISGNGQVVVGYSYAQVVPGPSVGAFRWEDGVLTVLDQTASLFGSAEPEAVSFDGSVIVGAEGTITHGLYANAARWTDGVLEMLPSPPGEAKAGATSVSADGNILGGWVDRGASVGACRWADGAATVLGDASHHNIYPATGMSADGSKVVTRKGYLWDSGVMTRLSVGDEYYQDIAVEGMSADGSVAVGMRVHVPDTVPPWSQDGEGEYEVLEYQPCLWVNGATEPLLTLDGGDPNGLAKDASADGSVVVGHTYELLPEAPYLMVDHAFVWTEAKGLVVLEELLTDDYALDLTGWTLTEAVAISDDGLTIVGNGLYDDGLTDGLITQAWIAHIPEPTTGLVLMVGLGGVVLRRRRRWDLGARASRLGMLVLAVLLSGSSSETLAAGPSFHGLGAETTVADISGNGQVVVGYSYAQVVPGQSVGAFRWEDGVLTVLSQPGQSLSPARPQAVSFDGSVIVGHDGQPSVGLDGDALRWADDDVELLPSLTGYAKCGATALSGDGSIIAGYVERSPDGVPCACKWDGDGPVMFRIDGRSAELPVIGISNDGSKGAIMSGLLWDNGVMTQLTGGDDYYEGVRLEGMSADGSVAVGMRAHLPPIYPFFASEDEDTVKRQPCRWVNGVPEPLLTLDGGDPNGLAKDASADGSTIVGCTYVDLPNWPYFTEDEAFLWTEDIGLVVLEELLADDYGLDLTGWTLTEAVAISDDGLTIVGNGLYDDGLTDGLITQAWIAHIPEPTTGVMLMVGLAGLAARTGRRTR